MVFPLALLAAPVFAAGPGLPTRHVLAPVKGGARISIAGYGQGADTNDRRGYQQQQPPPAPLIWPVDNHHAAPRAEDRAREADEREARNLRAQERIADAAERQQVSAWWQTVFSFVGTAAAVFGAVFLVRTFKETQRTATAAVGATAEAARSAIAAERNLALARETARIQLRPNVAFDRASITSSNGTRSWDRLGVQIRNFGATTAVGLRVNLSARPAMWPPDPLPPLPPSDHWSAEADMPNGQTSVVQLDLDFVDEFTRGLIYQRTAGFLITLRVRYSGYDGTKYESTADMVSIGVESLEGRVRQFNPEER